MKIAQVRPEDWRPRGIKDLEPNAWRALSQCGSACVVAGPGAGKTEFLAQRAAFLLETGGCPAPFRILAISFKKDAADNLAARVRQRCPPELSNRFTSLTFEAFAKSLVDRFITAIPIDWRPSRPYEIAFPSYRQVQGFLQNALSHTPNEWKAQVAQLSPSDFEARHVGSYRLPTAPVAAQSGIELTIRRWWTSQISAQPRSSMTFVSVNRLAELLLRAAPHVRRALQITYPFVFVDEFQDTTYAQYDFLLSAFLDSEVAITAVGDDKQRIMTWAGAREDAFASFETAFRAVRIPLLFNFRSSPDLVRIQHVVARALDPSAAPTVAQAPRQVDGDVAQVWRSPTKAREAEHLGQWLASDMAARGRGPRDYAILVKQKSDDFETDLAGPLASAGLKLRNESHALGRTTLQDLLTDTLAKNVIALLRLGATRHAPKAWQLASTALLQVRAIAEGDDIGATRTENELTRFIAALRADMADAQPSEASALAFSERAFEFLNLGALARTYAEYSTGDLIPIMVEALQVHLASSASRATTWSAALDAFEGVDQISLMTVHKSKGLEYDTVIFIGLDDQAWWAHRPGNAEGLATFFVALSRAKQRAIFAFCGERGRRQRVAELFQLLRAAGVPEIPI